MSAQENPTLRDYACRWQSIFVSHTNELLKRFNRPNLMNQDATLATFHAPTLHPVPTLHNEQPRNAQNDRRTIETSTHRSAWLHMVASRRRRRVCRRQGARADPGRNLSVSFYFIAEARALLRRQVPIVRAGSFFTVFRDLDNYPKTFAEFHRFPRNIIVFFKIEISANF